MGRSSSAPVTVRTVSDGAARVTYSSGKGLRCRGKGLSVTTAATVREKIESLGYRIRYVPDELIGEHVACYHVVYQGRKMKPKAAESLCIPLNEIWISESYRDQEARVLYHELCEIEYRARGWKPGRAHRQASLDEESQFGSR